MAVQRQEFVFHPNYEEVNLTHLCFADDIFLFAGGTSSSVQVIMDEIKKFENFSGLQVNEQKTAIFLAWVNVDVKMRSWTLMVIVWGVHL